MDDYDGLARLRGATRVALAGGVNLKLLLLLQREDDDRRGRIRHVRLREMRFPSFRHHASKLLDASGDWRVLPETEHQRTADSSIEGLAGRSLQKALGQDSLRQAKFGKPMNEEGPAAHIGARLQQHGPPDANACDDA